MLLGMLLSMEDDRVPVGEGSAALFALEGLALAMHGHVLLQVRVGGKRLVTAFAREGFDLVVYLEGRHDVRMFKRMLKVLLTRSMWILMLNLR